MINLLNMDESKVEIFPRSRIQQARKCFNEGWWKGFSAATIAIIGGYAIGFIGTSLILNYLKEEEV